jgi:septum formation protein
MNGPGVTDGSTLVLASRSPRRLELLSLLIPQERIVVRPPASADEEGFEDCVSIGDIERRLLSIARGKRMAVNVEMAGDVPSSRPAILAADTTIVAEDAAGHLAVLGQPPAEDRTRPTVREWFTRYYFARPHRALTAVSLQTAEGAVFERVVSTTVTMDPRRAGWLDWYLSTSEPEGKAGGYAIQGLASVFIGRVEGSLSNVVGLPLAETREMLVEAGMVSG